MIGKLILVSTVVLGIGLSGAGAGAAGADPIPLGSEFELNSTTTGDQRGPRTAASSSGAFVAVWQGPESGGSQGIRAQRYSSSGVAAGSEFVVNGTTSGDQTQPAVAMLAQRRFRGRLAGAGRLRHRHLRPPLLANGTAVSSEVAVNATTTGAQETPAVAYLEDGQILVAWRSDGQDGSSGGIYARTIAANGTASSELLVNTTTTGEPGRPGGSRRRAALGALLRGLGRTGRERHRHLPAAGLDQRDAGRLADRGQYHHHRRAGKPGPGRQHLRRPRRRRRPAQGRRAEPHRGGLAGAGFRQQPGRPRPDLVPALRQHRHRPRRQPAGRRRPDGARPERSRRGHGRRH